MFKIITLLGCAASAQTLTDMKQALDDMADFYIPGSVYDPDYFNKNITECLAKWDDNILAKSQDNAWKQFTNYWLSNGTNSDYMHHTDHWGQC